MNAIFLDPLVYTGVQTSLVINTARGDTKKLKITGRFLTGPNEDSYVDVYPNFVSLKTRQRLLYQKSGPIDVDVFVPDAEQYYFKASGFSGTIFGEFGNVATVTNSAAGNPAPLQNIKLPSGILNGVSLSADTITGDTTGESVDCFNELSTETMYLHAFVNAVNIPGNFAVRLEESLNEVSWSSIPYLVHASGIDLGDVQTGTNGDNLSSFVRTKRHVRVLVDAAVSTDVRFAASIIRIPQGVA